MDIDYLKRIVEGALLAAGQPLSLNQLNSLFPEGEQPGHGPLREALAALDAELEDRAVELRQVGSGYRIQIRTDLMPFISQLWVEKPPRYSRALLETLAIIAYRQPITRGEIEQIRGVSVSSNILRTLQERDWIRVVGHRDVPGRPELIGTTKAFLDYFNLKSLDELPTLAEIKDIDNLEPELELQSPESDPDSSNAQKDAHEQVDEKEDNQPQFDDEEEREAEYPSQSNGRDDEAETSVEEDDEPATQSEEGPGGEAEGERRKTD
ncbi:MULTISPECIES: SMC-Scp complex subunit ScpB [unclassified Wenzhouxiangella]|uniref:SMC-Scp complex subunit ScpB n=1 Tax=unclassified Wenzhouxiangella TaxID=2613841 RepID=UPI000E32B3EC|nr:MULTISPECIES: SMC-Scp complex subunit ScpB [unclassified Wenzhouxiangella]RFF27985.1 SMC-Scp complex subunit ScpB [Wenzhouxiangella sp. 15181]RFP68572.1 SMC-Scp complex subunit ScpB [Wenzhouxiangella sp. 15190]